MKEGTASKIRGLIVDDDPGILKVVSIQLKLSGHEVQTTTSGAEAIDIIRTQELDYVLLDVVMPGVTGMEVLESVRSFSQVPIIIFTGHPTITKLALKIGANDCISKPFDPDLLLKKIEQALCSHRSAKEAHGVKRESPHR